MLLLGKIRIGNPDSNVDGANMGPIWDPDGSHIGPMNFAIWEIAVETIFDKSSGKLLSLSPIFLWRPYH